VNNAIQWDSAAAVIEAFRDALIRGERAFLWGVPGGGVFAAVGEGTCGLRVGAPGFRGAGALWRPAAIVATGDAFGVGVQVDAPAASTGPTTDTPPTGPSAHWVETVERATAEMRAGALRKVVLARTESRRAPPDQRYDATATWLALRAANPQSFTFAVHESGRTFVGATPERLATLAGDTLLTEALAGTAPRDTDPERLLASEKDRDEHAVVVSAILAGLAAHVLPDSLRFPATPSLKALPRLWHLHTPITARLRPGATLADVVLALHPTPAVCGVPRAAAAAFLSAHEGFDRGPYAGPVGWMSDAGQGSFAVGIRSATLAGAEATLYAGAGLVVGSEPAAEWRETALKLQTVDEMLRTS
jgi:isochorismate synthase